ncbi:aldo/keto reductase [Paraburkholderia unamae]|uniref:Aryl-alcohol dehydrogenase-like predicted oxidoreductase n=1 Tax=Paraburkholderia unamae TaxID=219649 RepID=A0ABX5KNI6_9BURK|nr:aldo/keto reductase [Paraburkholderia unamae]PVX81860.1 aryl-alcohol dehydrogenase-like predicted oxidoreductase [Paraburkholderia unamae]
MSEPLISASASGTFKLAGEVDITRLGYGAMRITGPGIWGPPEDPAEALRVLESLPESGIDFVDTADSYGPEVSEQLIREALHPYKHVLVATKAGLRRPGPDQWQPDGRPEYLRERALRSLKNLGVEQIGLWQLHRIDPAVPADEQFDAVKALQKEGIVRFVGLSEVTVEEIKAASKYFTVATVQNRYNLLDRQSESVLEYCEANNIGFIPWYPLAAGNIGASSDTISEVARDHGASPMQIAIAWLLHKSPVILPIPGTSKRTHLRANVAAAAIKLSDEEMSRLNALAS